MTGPYLKVHKTMVNFSYESMVRRFTVSSLGTHMLAKVAAKTFEKETLSIIRDFEKLTKKPDARKDFLLSYGWPKDRCCKRNIALQKGFVLKQLCEGKVDGVEAKICQAIVRHTVPPEKQKKCFVTLTHGGFKATLSGSKQVVEQVFKTVGAACSWLAQIAQADEDRICDRTLGTLALQGFYSKHTEWLHLEYSWNKVYIPQSDSSNVCSKDVSGSYEMSVLIFMRT